jgi:hypothetical protein
VLERFCYKTQWSGGSHPGYSNLRQFTDKGGRTFETNSVGFGGFIEKVTDPEGSTVQYAWDARGNVTQIIRTPKPGSPLSAITQSAGYDATCTVQVKCNKPNWVRDGRGNQTDYTYDPVHGGVLTETLPADDHGVRPQTRYAYSQRYAWVKNSSGSYVQSASPIWVVDTESSCRKSQSNAVATANMAAVGCTTATDEVVKTYEYGLNAGPNNLFLKGFSVTADGTTRRTCIGYDRLGNRISETKPNAALASCS